VTWWKSVLSVLSDEMRGFKLFLRVRIFTRKSERRVEASSLFQRQQKRCILSRARIERRWMLGGVALSVCSLFLSLSFLRCTWMDGSDREVIFASAGVVFFYPGASFFQGGRE
jgi:hypothetical protein